MGFHTWLEANEIDQEMAYFAANFKQAAMRTVKQQPGFLSFSFPKPAVSTLPQTANAAQPTNQLIAAATKHDGQSLHEVTEKDWKGRAAIASLGPQLNHWSDQQKASFQKAMSGGKRSIPALVGKELGLLFEIYTFVYLVQNYKLQPVGEKDLSYVLQEQSKLEKIVGSKLRDRALTASTIDFIRIHAATPPSGMGELIYRKTVQLITECKVDAVEYRGGTPTGGFDSLEKDTADLRVGCRKYLEGTRANVGWSLKAVSDPAIDVRHFSISRAAEALGGGKYAFKQLGDIVDNPLYDEAEKRTEIIQIFYELAVKNYQDKPQKFARLLELLVTGGADTLPAYRSLSRNIGEPGWSGAINQDFATRDTAGSKLGAKLGNNPKITVTYNNTYVTLTYKGDEGSNYGTSIRFEPNADASMIYVHVNNLVSRGGRGY